MRIGRRTALAGGLALLAPGVHAQDNWPDRPVSVVNPFAAGGFTDGFGRTILQQLQRGLGQPFIMDYRPGAGATLGAKHVIAAAPDGYTLLYSPTTAWVLAPYLYRSAGYDPLRDLTPICAIAETPMVLCTKAALPFRTVAELVAAARAQRGAFSYASAGAGSLPHLMGAFFTSLAGIEVNHVPYRGGGPAMNDLVAGHVDIFWEAIPNVTQHVGSGRVKALMISGPGRSPLLPEVPTVAEAGYPDVNLTSWIGLGGPAHLPAPITAALNRETNKALDQLEVRANMERLAFLPIGGPPEVMRQRMEREGTIYRRIIAEARITLD